MEIDINLLDALIKTCRWSDHVAKLFGPEWNSNGNQLIDLIWGEVYERFGVWGTDMINEFITNYKTAYRDENGEIIMVTSVSQLMDVLNKYCLIEKE